MVVAQSRKVPPVAAVWEWLRAIPDPEIPVISIVDLGIVRAVEWSADETELCITITPTYSGCPAMDVIGAEIRSSIGAHGIAQLRLETRLSPAWTTDWMPDAARERLREYGIAPPPALVAIAPAQPLCPRCGAQDTEVVSRFGSTPCKALYKCRVCLEPFDVFKRH